MVVDYFPIEKGTFEGLCQTSRGGVATQGLGWNIKNWCYEPSNHNWLWVQEVSLDDPVTYELRDSISPAKNHKEMQQKTPQLPFPLRSVVSNYRRPFLLRKQMGWISMHLTMTQPQEVWQLTDSRLRRLKWVGFERQTGKMLGGRNGSSTLPNKMWTKKSS